MHRSILLCIILLAACRPIHKITEKAEEEHYALYKQTALIVYQVKRNRVFLVNPPLTRYYYLKGKRYSRKWHEGDTLLIDSNLADFYDLKFVRK